MEGLTIIGGKYKNRKLPIPPSVKGNLHFTPATLKKASFSIMEAKLLQKNLEWADVCFIDGFAGSGQNSMEAISRGCEEVHAFEIDPERIKSLIAIFKKESGFTIHKKNFFKITNLKEIFNSKKLLIFYIDPPFVLWDEKEELLKELSTNILQTFSDSIVLWQSPKLKDWGEYMKKEYGNQILFVHG